MKPAKYMIIDDELIEKDNEIRMATYVHEYPQRMLQEKQRKLVDQHRKLSMMEITKIMRDLVDEYPKCKKEHAKLNILVRKLEALKYDVNMPNRLIDQAWQKSVDFITRGILL